MAIVHGLTPLRVVMRVPLRVAMLVAMLVLALAGARAQDAPPSTIMLGNQLGMLLAQSRGGGLPAAEYERRLATLSGRLAPLVPQLGQRSVDLHALVERVRNLSPTALNRPELQPGWDRVMAAHPEVAQLADPKRHAKAATASDEAAWARALWATLKRVEAEAGRIDYERFQAITETEFMPTLRKLHQSSMARLRALPESAAGDDPAFAALDDGAAGATFVLAERWLQIPEVRKARRTVLGKLDDKKSLGTKDSEEWVFHASHLARLAGDIRNEMAPLIEARIQRAVPPSAQPRLKTPPQTVPSPELLPSRERLRMTVYGTPYQIAEARRDFERLVRQSQAIEYATQLDDRVRATREAFWRCHYRDCPGQAALYGQMLAALLEKDLQHLGINGVSQAPIDGGPLPACQQSFAQLQRKVQDDAALQDRQVAGELWRSAVQSLLTTPEYLRYQGCRDIQEIALRPRKLFF